MIVIKTNLKEVPKNCKECKYMYYDDYLDRYDCKLLFWLLSSPFFGENEIFYFKSIEAKKENCPIGKCAEMCVPILWNSHR
jgi:hypothetical protein